MERALHILAPRRMSLDPPEIRQGRLSCSIIRCMSFHRICSQKHSFKITGDRLTVHLTRQQKYRRRILAADRFEMLRWSHDLR